MVVIVTDVRQRGTAQQAQGRARERKRSVGKTVAAQRPEPRCLPRDCESPPAFLSGHAVIFRGGTIGSFVERPVRQRREPAAAPVVHAAAVAGPLLPAIRRVPAFPRRARLCGRRGHHADRLCARGGAVASAAVPLCGGGPRRVAESRALRIAYSECCCGRCGHNAEGLGARGSGVAQVALPLRRAGAGAIRVADVARCARAVAAPDVAAGCSRLIAPSGRRVFRHGASSAPSSAAAAPSPGSARAPSSK